MRCGTWDVMDGNESYGHGVSCEYGGSELRMSSVGDVYLLANVLGRDIAPV
jgi:hypothetical protein